MGQTVERQADAGGNVVTRDTWELLEETGCECNHLEREMSEQGHRACPFCRRLFAQGQAARNVAGRCVEVANVFEEKYSKWFAEKYL